MDQLFVSPWASLGWMCGASARAGGGVKDELDEIGPNEIIVGRHRAMGEQRELPGQSFAKLRCLIVGQTRQAVGIDRLRCERPPDNRRGDGIGANAEPGKVPFGVDRCGQGWLHDEPALVEEGAQSCLERNIVIQIAGAGVI